MRYAVSHPETEPAYLLFVPRVRFQTCGLDSIYRTEFVILRYVAAQSDRSQDLSRSSANEHSPGNGNHAAPGHVGQGSKEHWHLRRTTGKFSTAESHSKNAPRLPHGNLRPDKTGAVFPFQGLQLSTGIQHGHGQGSKTHLPPFLQGFVDNNRSHSERQPIHRVTFSFTSMMRHHNIYRLVVVK